MRLLAFRSPLKCHCNEIFEAETFALQYSLNLTYKRYKPFFFRQRFAKTAFSAVRSWLVGPKIGGHLGTAKTALGRHELY